MHVLQIQFQGQSSVSPIMGSIIRTDKHAQSGNRINQLDRVDSHNVVDFIILIDPSALSFLLSIISSISIPLSQPLMILLKQARSAT
jgi:hypothetical protein